MESTMAFCSAHALFHDLCLYLPHDFALLPTSPSPLRIRLNRLRATLGTDPARVAHLQDDLAPNEGDLFQSVESALSRRERSVPPVREPWWACQLSVASKRTKASEDVGCKSDGQEGDILRVCGRVSQECLLWRRSASTTLNIRPLATSVAAFATARSVRPSCAHPRRVRSR